MKEKKIKVIAMILSLFAACGGMSSAMETSKSEKNSKMNLKFDQNNNKTQNNKPQSDGKSNENSGVQIPYYAYPVGYLGLNEVGGLLGFDYLLFGKFGIIKGAKHLLFGKSNKKVEDKANEVNNEVGNKINNNKANDGINNEIDNEVEEGQYWQHNYDMIMNTNASLKYPDDYSNEQFEKTLERIMKWPNEKILSGKPFVKVNGDYASLGNKVTGFSYENFLKNLHGNRKINWTCRGVHNVFEFTFEGICDREFTLSFNGGFWGDNELVITLGKSYNNSNWVMMSFSAQPELYSW